MTTTVASLRAVFTGDNTDLMAKGRAVQNMLKETRASVKQNMMLEKEEARAQAQNLRSMQQQMSSFASVQRQKYAEMQKYSLAGQYQQISKNVNAAAMGMAKFAAAGVAVGYATKQVYEFGKSGAQIEYTQIKFDRLARSVGTTGGLFIKDLRGATRGTVSDFKLLEQGSNLLQLGLAKDANEATRLSKVMTALGMDTGELTLALANQSKRRLDQLGLSLTKFNEIEKRLKDSGMGKEEAFKEAFMQTAEQTVATTGNMADTNYGSFLRLEASGANWIDAYKKALPDQEMGMMFGGDTVAQTVEKVSQFMNGMAQLTSGETQWDFSGGLGAPSWVRQSQAQDLSSLWDAQSSNRGRGPGGTGFGAQIGLSAAQNYTAMAYANRDKVSGAGGAEAEKEAVDYNTMLQGSLQLTSATNQLTEARADLNTQLRQELDNFNLLTSQGYEQNSTEVQKVRDNISQLKTEIQAAGAAETDMVNQLMMANIAAAASEEERSQKQLDFALASGQVTQDAYNQQSALLGIADAFAAGEMNAEQAAKAAQMVMTNLEMLDGMTVDAFINLIVNGAMPNLQPQKTVQQSTSSSSNPVTATMQASGGPLAPVAIVGDGPGGAWTPYTEVIANGYVYNNKQATAMRDRGMLKGARKFRIGGDLAGTGVFGTEGGTYPGYYTPAVKTSGGGGGASAPSVVTDIVAPVVAGITQDVTTQTQAQIVTMQKLDAKTSETNALLKIIAQRIATAGEIGTAVNGLGNKWNG